MIQARHTIGAGKEPETIRALPQAGFTGARSEAPEMGHANEPNSSAGPLPGGFWRALSGLVAGAYDGPARR